MNIILYLGASTQEMYNVNVKIEMKKSSDLLYDVSWKKSSIQKDFHIP